MYRYKNINGNSNVEAYAIGADYIEVKFYNTSRLYRYSYASAGMNSVETMKQLAQQGYGLNSFIMRNVRFSYEK